MTADPDTAWQATWEPLIAAVGTDLSAGRVTRGADPIERSTVRRYLEPLELDCPLHLDPDVARAHGHPDVTAPYTSVLTYTIAPMWRPGRRLFTSDERDAQPASSPIDGGTLRVAPWITGFFATDIELDFLRPPVVGDHLSRRGETLLSCSPKWISVGRGAFLTLQSDIVTDTGEVIARWRSTVFAYEPVTRAVDTGRGVVASTPEIATSGSAPPRVADPADLRAGALLDPVPFPLSVYRLVMAAGANRDFNSIHHNSRYAQATGAPEMYANTSFLLGMWERAVRELIGPGGTILSIAGFRMRRFNPVGTTTVVRGRVRSVGDGGRTAVLAVWCDNGGEVTVGPGQVTVALAPKGSR
jgi:acyl dehydratase